MIVRTYRSEIRRIQPKPKPKKAAPVRVHCFWSEQEVAQLRKLLAAGLTYGQIQHRMAERSRSSIAGRVARMKREDAQ